MPKKLALTLAGLLAALLAAEILVRLLGVAPIIYPIRKGRFQLSHNPRIGYEPVPLVYDGRELSFYDYRGASNSLGYRDVEHAVAKARGVYRIVVLGNSVAAGLGVDRYEDTFPPILERELGSRGLRAEVINLAVSGYNPQQQVATLEERGLQYEPDLVLVAYTLTARQRLDGDIMKTLLEAEREKGGVSTARLNPVLVGSALYRFLRFRVLAPPGAPNQAEGNAQRYLAAVSGDTVAPSFDRLAALARAHPFEVLVVVFPRFVRSFRAYRLGGEHRFARDLAQRHGFRHLDLLADFERCRAAGSVPIEFDVYHPSAYGHHCAADAIAREILSELHRG
jgi:hypothetical protein